MLLKNNWLEWKIIFFFFFPRVERSTDQVIKPVNVEALSKWVGKIPADVLQDMPVIAPMLAKLGYDPYANPPNYGKPDQKVVENTRRVRFGLIIDWRDGSSKQELCVWAGHLFLVLWWKMKEFFGALSCAPRCVELNLLRAAQKVGELINSGKKNLSCLDFKLDGWAQFL